MSSRFVNLVALVGGVAVAVIAAQRFASSVEDQRAKAAPAVEQGIEDIELAQRPDSRTAQR